LYANNCSIKQTKQEYDAGRCVVIETIDEIIIAKNRPSHQPMVEDAIAITV